MVVWQETIVSRGSSAARHGTMLDSIERNSPPFVRSHSSIACAVDSTACVDAVSVSRCWLAANNVEAFTASRSRRILCWSLAALQLNCGKCKHGGGCKASLSAPRGATVTPLDFALRSCLATACRPNRPSNVERVRMVHGFLLASLLRSCSQLEAVIRANANELESPRIRSDREYFAVEGDMLRWLWTSHGDSATCAARATPQWSPASTVGATGTVPRAVAFAQSRGGSSVSPIRLDGWLACWCGTPMHSSHADSRVDPELGGPIARRSS
jgi:hypothetical protein